ncbi:integral membrane DUF92 protein [Rutstroemia sp. NJR-2017a BBW]|nr:integral membrane DUF92 protein [Rutstroemia sp. NJR-2017a BBW]
MKAIIAVPVTLAIVYRAGSHKSLTPAGIVAAVITAAAHAVHPWNLPFALLMVFYLAGSRVTKVKHDVKAKLTMNAKGASGGEGARTHVQVLSNSIVASVLTLMHAYQLHNRTDDPSNACFSWGGDLLVVGIVANYAAVAADTFSSELGILSTSKPRLITSPSLRQVPPGTNGGVTIGGLVAGLLGSLIIVTTSIALLPFCGKDVGSGAWTFLQRQRFTFALTIWGALGSLLDSFLGGWFQMSVVDTRTGRIVEADGGKRVIVGSDGPSSIHYSVRAALEGKQHIEGADNIERFEEELDEKMGMDPRKAPRKSSFKEDRHSRKVENGYLNILDNNEVNLLMALSMSLGAMAIAGWVWEVPFSSIYTF